MNRLKVLLLIAFGGITACSHEPSFDLDASLNGAISKASKTGSTDYFVLPSHTDYANFPYQDPSNPMTREKVELGKLLFFETALAQKPLIESSLETYSCSTCHVPERGFTPGRMQGIADGAIGFGHLGSQRVIRAGYSEADIDAQGARPLTVLNSGYSTNTLWSGMFGASYINEGTEYAWHGLPEVNNLGLMGLETQNIENFVIHRMDITDKLLDDYGYRPLFDDAFGDWSSDERYSIKAAAFALSAFLRSMTTHEAPFQDYLRGNAAAMTEVQKEGALLFFGKANCSNCHNSPALSNMEFHALGTKDIYEQGAYNTSEDDPRNLGRAFFTDNAEHLNCFKVPQLYNVKDFATYFHGSSKKSVREVVEFKVKAESENPHVTIDKMSQVFRPLDLTPDEINKLVDFIENGLYDPNVATKYTPSSVLSGNCFPNNDIVSQYEMGCK